MSKWKTTATVAALMTGAFVAGRLVTPNLAIAQPEKKSTTTAQPGKSDKGNMPAMDMTHMKPGAEHKQLEPLIGTFEGTVKFWMAPDQSPMETKGKVTREWTLDNHFVKEQVDGDPMEPGGTPFKGLGFVGYNTIDKNFESAWFENHATWMTTAKGNWDASKKTFTFTGDCICPITHEKMRSRHTLDISNPDREVMTGWATGADGKEWKNFEGVFQRVKK
jgi:hypothetical protein